MYSIDFTVSEPGYSLRFITLDRHYDTVFRTPPHYQFVGILLCHLSTLTVDTVPAFFAEFFCFFEGVRYSTCTGCYLLL